MSGVANNKTRFMLLAAVYSFVLVCAPARSQEKVSGVTADNKAADENAAQDGGGDDITVTARYRRESAQDVPIAITALSGETLDRQGAFNLKQVVQQLPSLNIQGISGRNQTITIRGIGTNAGGTNDGLEQGVGLYIDGVYRPRTGSVITDLIDVESIQLLRGPQGTLFGKNTVAGAIDIRTREPSFDKPEGRAELSYGNYNYLRGYVAVGAPLSDDLAVRVSYLRTQRDGLIHNTTYREKWDGLDNHAARFDAVWKPSDDVKLRLTADYSLQVGDVGFQSVAAVLPTTLSNGTQVRGFYRRAADVGYTPIPIDPFARRVDIDSSQYDEMPSWGIALRGDWTLGGGLTLTSLSAFRRWQWIPNYDGDQFGANVSTQSIVKTDQRQVSQEFRLASPGNQTIDYSGGLYFFWQKADDLSVTGYGRDAAAWLTTANTPTAAVSTLPSAALDGLLAIAEVIPQTYSYAGYGQATWNVSAAFRVTGGLRYTWEHKTGYYNAYAGGTAAPISSFPAALQPTVAARRAALTPSGRYTAERDTRNLSGTVTLAYDVTPDVHSYATYSRGYKSPGINLVARANGVDIFVRPEKVDAFELGLKNRFWHDRAELNLAAFWTEDNDYQANFVNNAVTPVVAYITNVGKLRSRGVEVDARLNPIDGLTLTAAGTYNDARYVTYRAAPAQYLNSYLGLIDLSGRTASGAPKWALTGTAEYVHHAGGTDVYVGGDASYRSAFYAAVNLDPYSRVPGYGLAGLHAGVRQPDGHWDVSVWVRNLTDTDFYNTKAVNNTYGLVFAALGEPRTFGLTLRGKL